jgi:hypothetical protein
MIDLKCPFVSANGRGPGGPALQRDPWSVTLTFTRGQEGRGGKGGYVRDSIGPNSSQEPCDE